MDEKQLRIFSVAGTVACLILIYVFVSLVGPEHLSVKDICDVYRGKIVSVSGTVGTPMMENGNVFFTLDDGTGEVDVFIWKDTADVMLQGGIDVNSLSEGDNLTVTGVVEFYRGKLELIPRGNGDIEIL